MQDQNSQEVHLCISCRSIRLETIFSKDYQLHKNWTSLETAISDCEVCQVVYSTIMAKAEESYPRHVNRYLQGSRNASHLNINSDPRSLSLPLNWLNGVDSSIWLELVKGGKLVVSLGEAKSAKDEFVHTRQRKASISPVQDLIESLWEVEVDIHITEASPLCDMIQAELRQPLAASSLDAETMNLARRWMSECIDTHELCIRTGKPSDVPRRLLDLSKVKDNLALSLLTIDHDCPSYAALSYSWGPDRDSTWIEYVREIQNSSSDIRLTSMPILLQDIVHVTLKQGFRFLWIDCLCILQGNADDWLIESAKMGGIYEGCDLMLCTTGCTSCNESVLTPRTLKERHGVVLPIFSEDGSYTGAIHFQQPKLSNTLGPESRAWCLQELRLTPRVLHVCHNELIYQCKQGNYVESRGMSFEPSRHWPGMPYEVAPSIYGPHDSRKPRADISGVVGWAYIVTDYTRRSMSETSDRLIAISGLAQKAQHTIGSRYLAGIWEKYIHIGLAWTAGYEFTYPDAKRSPKHRAPSWSWTSVDGAISWRLLDLPLCAHLDEATIDPRDKSRSAIEVVNIFMGANEHDPYFDEGTMEISLIGSINRIPSSKLLANEHLNSFYVIIGTTEKIGYYYHDEGRTLEGELICLRLMVQNLGFTPGLPEAHIVLLLECVTGNRYKRIGSGEIYDESIFNDNAAERQSLILI